MTSQGNSADVPQGAGPALPAMPDLGCGLYGETRLITAQGTPRQVARLVPGDRLDTFEHGPQTICAIERHSFADAAGPVPRALWPLYIPPGLFGNARARFAAPGQRLLLQSDLAAARFGDPYVLVPAHVLTLFPQVVQIAPSPERTLFHLRFARPELVISDTQAVMLCDTAARFDYWSLAGSEDDGSPLRYTALPPEMALELLREELHAVALPSVTPTHPALAALLPRRA